MNLCRSLCDEGAIALCEDHGPEFQGIVCWKGEFFSDAQMGDLAPEQWIGAKPCGAAFDVWERQAPPELDEHQLSLHVNQPFTALQLMPVDIERRYCILRVSNPDLLTGRCTPRIIGRF